MSLNAERVGRLLAQIDGGKQKDKVVSVSTKTNDDDVSHPFPNLKLTGDSVFQHIPDPDTEREILYITGASGSGKSTYTKNYCKKWVKLKKKPIYLFSSLKEDESLDEIKPQRIILDERLVTEPIPVDDFAESLVIFDDIDVISDKKIREAVYSILNQILEVGRHHKIFCILTNHLPYSGKDTRRILNEAHCVVWFPFSGSGVGMKRLLCDYLGLDKTIIKKTKSLKSRWCCLFKNYPQVLMTEKNIWLAHTDDD